MDKLGTRRGFAIAVGIWSVAAVGHALAERMDWMKLPTINLDPKTGLPSSSSPGPPPGSPSCGSCSGSARRATSPPRSRRWRSGSPRRSARSPPASSTRGRTSAPSSRPLVVPWITLHWGWEWAFVATGLTGLRLAGLVARACTGRPKNIPRLSPAELAYIRSDPAEKHHAHPLGARSSAIGRPGPSPSASS